MVEQTTESRQYIKIEIVYRDLDKNAWDPTGDHAWGKSLQKGAESL